MRVYKIELAAKGALTQLPDSQKIFGALVYMFSETYGSEKATELTSAVLDKKIHLTLSNLMPSSYFPVPQDHVMDRIMQSASEGEQLKRMRMAIKERSYLKEAELRRILKDPRECVDIYPYVKLQNQQQIRASLESIRYDIPELESKLYSVPTVVLQEILSDKKSKEQDREEQERPIKNFCFYLQMEDNDGGEKLLSMLKAAEKEKRIIILGKRASQSLNTFEFLGVAEVVDENLRYVSADTFLNMGMLLPDEINFAASKLKLFTSERRPFQMSGGWNKNFSKQFISFIAEGSIISAKAGSVRAGKSIPSPFNSRDIVFGNAFLYPVALDEGGM